MAKRKQPKSKFALSIGCDPSLWRFSSRDEAVAASTHLIAQVIKHGEALMHELADVAEEAEAELVLEEA